MPLGQTDQRQTRGGVQGPSAHASKMARRTGFGDGGGRGGSSSGNGNGSRRGSPPEGVSVRSYDEDVHADQDAADIVSDMPSSSRPGFR